MYFLAHPKEQLKNGYLASNRAEEFCQCSRVPNSLFIIVTIEVVMPARAQRALMH